MVLFILIVQAVLGTASGSPAAFNLSIGINGTAVCMKCEEDPAGRFLAKTDSGQHIEQIRGDKDISWWAALSWVGIS